jgi:hypothetical protein
VWTALSSLFMLIERSRNGIAADGATAMLCLVQIRILFDRETVQSPKV